MTVGRSDEVVRLLVAASCYLVTAARWAITRSRGQSRLRRFPPAVVALIGVGLGASLSRLTITGNALADHLWGAAIVAALALAGSVAGTTLTAVALAVAASGLSITWGLPAAGVVGVLLGIRTYGRRRPWWFGAAAGAILGAGWVSQSSPHTLVLPGIGALAIGASAIGRSSPTGRRRIAGVGAAGLVLGLSAAGSAGIAALRSQHVLERGLARARDGLQDARGGRAADATSEMSLAAADLGTGRRRLEAWWVRPALFVPVVGPNLRALAGMARSGADLARVGSDISGASQVRALKVSGGHVPLQQLASLDPLIVRAREALIREQKRAPRLGSPWLLEPVHGRLDRFRSAVATASQSTSTVLDGERLARSLLGEQSSRRYFLALSTPGELRGATGLIGNFGELVADHGMLSLTRFGRHEELDGAAPTDLSGLPVPEDFLLRYGRDIKGYPWLNVPLSPDFPTVASALEWLYPRSGGQQVDGVVGVDPVGLAAILRVTGPVSVPQWPVPLTPDNVVAVLVHDQYSRLPVQQVRLDFLHGVASAVVGRLRQVDIQDVPYALTILGQAVSGKHLLVDTSSVDEGGPLRRLGLSGAFPRYQADDFLGVFSANGGGNKLDWFLRRLVTYRSTVNRETSTINAQVVVTLTNTATGAGDAAEVMDSAIQPPLPRGTNRVLLSVYSPWVLIAARVGSSPIKMESHQELNMSVYSALIDVPADSTRAVVLELQGSYLSSQYHLTVAEQPTATPDRFEANVRTSGGGTAWSGSLLGDLTLTGK